MDSEHPELAREDGAPHTMHGETAHYVAMVAHELRSPLMPILNAASLMARAPQEVDMVRRSAVVIERQARIIGRLIEDLMSVSSTRMGGMRLRRAPLAMTELLQQCVETVTPFALQRGLRLHVAYPREPLELFADSLRLEQALQNVLFNAVKFSHPGGEVRLAIERAGDEVLITVSDDGIGIAASELESIFELFKQGDSRHYGGLGIGLYLARQMIEAHHGSIIAASAGAGLGSTFSIRIPSLTADDYANGPRDIGESSRSDSVFTT